MAERSDRPLEVRPVRRYAVPRYPSHEDPDPTRHPRAIPYPFASSAVRLAASLGLTTSIVGMACGGDTASIVGASRAATAGGSAPDARPPHPLTLGQSGLPFRTSPYGTGEPELLDGVRAREVIDRLFGEAGYDLRKSWHYDVGGATFTADGFDPNRKVGYVFATWDKVEGDAIDAHWTTKLAGVERELGNLEYALPHDVTARIEKAKAMDDPTAREAALVAIRAEIARTRFSLADGRALERQAERHESFVAIIGQEDRRFIVHRDRIEVSFEQREAASGIADPIERQRALEALETEAAKRALAALEQAVREYLAWVKSQGG